MRHPARVHRWTNPQLCSRNTGICDKSRHACMIQPTHAHKLLILIGIACTNVNFETSEHWDLFGSNGKVGDNILSAHNAGQQPQLKAGDRNLLQPSSCDCTPRLTSCDSRLEPGKRKGTAFEHEFFICPKPIDPAHTRAQPSYSNWSRLHQIHLQGRRTVGRPKTLKRMAGVAGAL